LSIEVAMSRFHLQAGSLFRIAAVTALAAVVWLGGADIALTQDANIIWAPGFEDEGVPQMSCCFRKSFDIDGAESVKLSIAADDAYELFFNGTRIGNNSSQTAPDTYDVTRHLIGGRNVIAVKVKNTEGDSAGLAVKMDFVLPGGRIGYLISDESWVAKPRPLPLWHLRRYNDRSWPKVASLGVYRPAEPQLAQTEPPVDQPDPEMPPAVVRPVIPEETENEAEEVAAEHGDFTLGEGFAIELVASRQQTGSLIAVTFNEFGQIICSREDGPLLIVTDENDDSVPETVRVWCDKVKNCQGLLALNGDVFAVGEGQQGPGLYRISDTNNDGTGDKVATVLQFTDEMGEHGPHGVVLGPDGLLYVVLGNHSAPATDLSPTSPYHDYYEGDLVQPRLEDSYKHAQGVTAPGGVVIRTDIKGDYVEVVAGGLRDAYDLAFNSLGELFTHENDMQWDAGLPWYRSPRFHLVTDGAEFGWRSGWAKWPAHYVDCLPDIGVTGQAAPTGMVFYDHHMFPARFHGNLFACDWQQGRILAVTVERKGAGYQAKPQVFAEGKPMNVTDIEVGPDGWLYFVTGGRGTPGGLYRIVWDGLVPEAYKNETEGIGAAVRQPQLQSAWARQQVAARMKQFSDDWEPQLIGAAVDKQQPPEYRVRALDLMQLFGPPPRPHMLAELSRDKSPELRAKTATLLGIYSDDSSHDRLVEMLDDEDPLVRRKVCEALAQAGHTQWSDKLKGILASPDRFEAWSARRLLERIDPAQWEDVVLQTRDHRLFIQGAIALLVVNPEPETAKKVVHCVREILPGFVSDADFIDLLRVTQLALLRGGLTEEDVPELRYQLADEYPAGDAKMNRELVRLLVHLNVTSIADRYIAQLHSEMPQQDRLHLGLHLSRLNNWTTDQKLELMKFYDRAMVWRGGRSYRGYVLRTAQQFAACLTDAERVLLLSQGAEFPNAAFAMLSLVPDGMDEIAVAAIKKLDRDLAGADGEPTKRLKIAIVAVLAHHADGESIRYLHDVFDRDPSRRHVIAVGLAQLPGDGQWEYLVRSLPALEGVAATEIIRKLASSDRAPNEAADFHNLIQLGRILDDDGCAEAFRLLAKWSGKEVGREFQGSEERLAAWGQWFAGRFPDYTSAEPTPADPDQPAASLSRQPEEATNR
jgi:HEAT repeat protein